MRFKRTSLVIVLAFILLMSSVAALGEVIPDATAGTVRAKLAPSKTWTGDSRARGNVVINYVKGQQVFEIQANVAKLTPNTDYTVYLHLGGSGAVLELGPFTTDQNGNGHYHVSYSGTIGPFDRVNIRLPFTSNSGVLSSIAPGGSLQQSPSQRSK